MNSLQIALLLAVLEQLWIASDRRPAAGRALNALLESLGLDQKPEYKS